MRANTSRAKRNCPNQVNPILRQNHSGGLKSNYRYECKQNVHTDANYIVCDSVVRHTNPSLAASAWHISHTRFLKMHRLSVFLTEYPHLPGDAQRNETMLMTDGTQTHQRCRSSMAANSTRPNPSQPRTTAASWAAPGLTRPPHQGHPKFRFMQCTDPSRPPLCPSSPVCSRCCGQSSALSLSPSVCLHDLAPALIELRSNGNGSYVKKSWAFWR